MIHSLSELIGAWQYTRGLTLTFAQELSDSDLDKPLPRKNLNTIRLQIEEMAMIQEDYINALATKAINFSTAPLKDTSTQGLIKKLTALDAMLEKNLESFDGTENIDWFGEAMNIHAHIAAMIGHENMHIGQIVAFCYATGITIPAKVVETMALDG
ncbi:MAG: DinB family protein [Defluviitaleaceae bacterium]|nr:DinB family protein [Defluviitaleaceae bacterium]